ncbi:hypothetical protein MKJ01_04785 [Chryseobacterium sp. SSA4.19]|uniref:hypothetical protein n=1 Tax=Chryseobacterium sp. SSA4.19 TaxID=2919915 RepID=UPI001F4D4A56|nr:hypothetical protein [Chryseobacterium sp. SSA4.19]MCJ8153081.1 hypothetical protein [Chryseobacterium sp. SSA4.19]
MKKHLYFFLLPALLLQNCSFLEQSDFIETKIISSTLNEKIIYRYYQTEVGHYKVDFYSVHRSDSTKLFEHTIDNDLLTANTYTISENENGLIIKTKLFCGEKKLTTQNGRSITLTDR